MTETSGRRRLYAVALAVIVLFGAGALLWLDSFYTDVAESSAERRARAGAHRVQVVAGESEPAPGVRVVVTWRTNDGAELEGEALTSAEGVAVPSPPSAGATPAWIHAYSGPLEVRVPGEPFAAAGFLDVQLALPRRFRLAGHVRTAAGEPVPAALVACAGVSGVTDEAGGFELAELPARAWFDSRLALRVQADRREVEQPLPRHHLPAYYSDLTVVLDGR